MITADTLTDDLVRGLLDHARGANDIELIRACFAALSTSEIGVSSWTKETALARCASAVNDYRAGAQACREMLAAFVEQGGSADIAASIRANWMPSLGTDPGRPVKPAPVRYCK